MAARVTRWACVAAACLLALLAGARLARGAPGSSSTSRVGEVFVEIFDVFDAPLAGPWNSLSRAANFLHARTREAIVRRELLFHAGDPFDPEALKQSERNLRALGLFRRVSVEALSPDRGVVPVRVRVHDAWSLSADATFKREGGFSTYGFRFREKNLAGLGVNVAMRDAVSFERRTVEASFSDSRFFGTRERIGAKYSALSDGILREVALSRPFYELDSASGHDLLWRNTRERYRTYENGEVFHEYDLHAVDVSAGALARIGAGAPASAWRAGGGYRYVAREFDVTPMAPATDMVDMPPSRRWGGPFAAVQFVQHRYLKRDDLIVPDRDVDFNLGLVVTADVFMSSPATGPATGHRLLAAASVERGWELPASSLAMVSVSASGEATGGLPARGDVGAAVRAWWPHSPTHVTAFFAAGHAFLKPERGTFEYLGGSLGLRGFREQQFAGTRSFLFIVEQRKYLEWRPAGLFRPGVAAFAEIGAIGGVARPGSRPLHGDVGVGLRLVSLRAGLPAVVQLDVAVPVGERIRGLSAAQFVVGFRHDF